MSLTINQRRKLDRLGVEAVTLRCMAPENWSRPTVDGLADGTLDRRDVEQWMAEQWNADHVRPARKSHLTLWLTVVAAGLVALVMAAIMTMPTAPREPAQPVACAPPGFNLLATAEGTAKLPTCPTN